MEVKLFEIKIGHEFYSFRNYADAAAAAGAMMRGVKIISSGRINAALEPITVEISSKFIEIPKARLQRALGEY